MANRRPSRTGMRTAAPLPSVSPKKVTPKKVSIEPIMNTSPLAKLISWRMP